MMGLLFLAGAHLEHTHLPHRLQWCRRVMKEKGALQIRHSRMSLSGPQVGPDCWLFGLSSLGSEKGNIRNVKVVIKNMTLQSEMARYADNKKCNTGTNDDKDYQIVRASENSRRGRVRNPVT